MQAMLHLVIVLSAVLKVGAQECSRAVEDLEEISQLQVSRTLPNPDIPASQTEAGDECDKTTSSKGGGFFTFHGAKGELSFLHGPVSSFGKLTISGPGVVNGTLIKDRPMHGVSIISSQNFARHFHNFTMQKDGGLPNAVLVGETSEGVLEQFELVLSSAEYQVKDSVPTLSFEFVTLQETGYHKPYMRELLQLRHVALFVDSFFCRLFHPAATVTYFACKGLLIAAKAAGVAGLSVGVCDGLVTPACLAVAPETAGIGGIACEGVALATVCPAVAAAFAGKGLSLLHASPDAVCKSLGFSDPC